MTLHTGRLQILLLTHEQLLACVAADHSFEKRLGLTETHITITDEYREVLEQIILPSVAQNESQLPYFSLWSVVVKTENRPVADLCFKGPPDANGEIEIGYGTYEQFRGKGYMTEAVGAIIEWAKQQPNVKAIAASTDKTNVASYTVLQKNQFVQVGESDELYHWKLKL
jgi:RimJ/RimL family protein N-acetyltransferase